MQSAWLIGFLAVLLGAGGAQGSTPDSGALGADVVTAFVPHTAWQISIELEGFQPFNTQTGHKTILGGSTSDGLIITVLIEPVKSGTSASEVRALYGAGRLDEKEGVETHTVGDVAVILYRDQTGGALKGANGYLVREDIAFDVHLSMGKFRCTTESILRILASLKIEESAECVQMATVAMKVTQRDHGQKEKLLHDFATRFPKNSWAQAMLGKQYFAQDLHQKAARAYSKALENHRCQPIVNPLLLWTCYDGLGVCFGILGRYDESLAHLKNAHQLADDLEHDQLIAASAYNLACWHAESLLPEESTQYLKEAIRLNPKNRMAARSDPSFHSIRQDIAFQALILPK